MEMHQIKYFLAVCSERNFTRAARLCRVSQPSLTRAIKLLEAEFGGLLFRREHANSHLTELGEIVGPHLQEVWEKSRAAVAQAQEFSAINRSRVKIGIMCTIAPKLLIDLLTRLARRHKSVELQTVDGSAAELQEQLLAGQISAAICCESSQKTEGRLVKVPLFRERMLVAMPREHRLAAQGAVAIADLAGETRIRRTRCECNELIEALLRRHKVQCDASFKSERDDWTLALISRDFGVCLLPEHSIDHPGVVARPLAEPSLWREVSLLTLKGQPQHKGLGALVHEAMQTDWASEAALAAQNHSTRDKS